MLTLCNIRNSLKVLLGSHSHRRRRQYYCYYYHRQVPFELLGNEAKNSGGRIWNVYAHTHTRIHSITRL